MDSKQKILAWVSVVGTVGTLTGVILSIYFYKAAQQFRGLSFLFDPRRTLIVSPEHMPTSRLTILDRDGKKIARDVYALEAYVWNSGTETIMHNDVIVPLTIAIPRDIRVLELQRKVTSRPEITAATAILTSDGEAMHVDVDFRVLEAGEGIAMTILYEGAKDVNLELSGGISGIKAFTDVTKSRPAPLSTTDKVNVALPLASNLMLVILVILERRSRHPRGYLLLSAILVSLMTIAVVLAYRQAYVKTRDEVFVASAVPPALRTH